MPGPAFLAVLAALTVAGTLVAVAPLLPVWALVVLGGAAAASLASAFYYRYGLKTEHEVLDRGRRELDAEQGALEAIRTELEQNHASLEKRRQGFEARLMTYHEWMEFPDFQGLAERDADPEAIDEKDKEVLMRVQQASDHFFEGFQNDRYSEDGKLQPKLLAGDLVEFVTSVAQVYQPDAEEPLLETSVGKLLKAVNHISLQLLFQLEQLPFNLKDYSLAKAYENIRTATKFYGYYKSVSPYLPYASYTWQIGRLVLGANPILAGTWLLGSEIMRRTGRRVSKHYLDRYTLKLTSEAIRIVANETAMTFDEDYRYRDPNWIYGLELAELVYQFPLSRETLQEALGEVGNLPLRNSYDRIFLYRCLATGRSPQPELFVRLGSLSQEQRREIVERLERFFRHHIHGRRRERVDKWTAGVSERLGIAVRVMEGEMMASESEELVAGAMASLGGFLIAVKEAPLPKLERALGDCQLATALSAAMNAEVINQLKAHPPMFFDFPNLDPESPMTDVYFSDLLALETAERPPDLQGLWAILEAAEYFRMDGKAIQTKVLAAHGENLKLGLRPDSPERVLSPILVTALIQLLEMDESPLFIYPKVMPEEAEAVLGIRLPGMITKPVRWLVGTPSRLVAVEVAEELEMDDFNRHRIIWELKRGEKGVVFERSRGLVRDQCVVRGGTWLIAGMESNLEAPGLAVPTDPLKRFDVYYAPLQEWIGSSRET